MTHDDDMNEEEKNRLKRIEIALTVTVNFSATVPKFAYHCAGF